MVSLLEAAKPPPPPAPVATAPKRPGVPLVYERSAVPAGFAWEPLIAEDNEAQDALVVVYPDGVERWTALVKLALTPLDIASIDSPGGYRVAVATGEHAAETVLVPDKMQRVRAELGGPKLIFVGMPARGELVAVDGERATLDDELQHDFMLVVEKRYLDAPERDRVTGDVVIYDERPIGRLPRV